MNIRIQPTGKQRLWKKALLFFTIVAGMALTSSCSPKHCPIMFFNNTATGK